MNEILDLKELQELLRTRQFSTIEPILHDRLRNNPKCPDTLYLLGALHYLRGEILKAVEKLQNALAENPSHTDAALCLSVIYNDIGKYDEAKAFFNQAHQSVAHDRTSDTQEVDIKFSQKHLELGDLYFKYRRYDDAIEEYSKASLLNPSAAEIKVRRAKAYSKKGLVSRAIQELQLVKNEKTDYLPARIQLGLLHFSLGNLLEAELEWEDAIQIDPQNRETLAYLEMSKKERLK